MSDGNYFKRLDYTKQDIPTCPFTNLMFSGSTAAVEYTPIEKFLSETDADTIKKIFDFTKSNREKNCGLGDAYIQEVKDKRNSGFYLKIKKDRNKDTQTNIFINFNMDEKNKVLYDQNFIHIEEGAKVKIFLYYDAVADDCGLIDFFRNGLLSIIAEKECEAELIKVQNLCSSGINFETVKIHALEHSHIRLYDIQLGGKINGSSSSTYIPEDWADVQIFPLYFADENRKIDLEHNFIINGKNSLALISARGALKNKAYKIFRGNIFLNKGCSRSAAKFSDNTIMLDKTAAGATIPTIFCDEDDVMGEHAASFEAVNYDKLYYLMTRGFDELSAKKLIVEAAFKPVFNMIDNEKIRERLLTEFRIKIDKVNG